MDGQLDWSQESRVEGETGVFSGEKWHDQQEGCETARGGTQNGGFQKNEPYLDVARR